ncbi:MAG: hypothetical protein ABR555_05800 [Pyrinomonadaceae bacterium]
MKLFTICTCLLMTALPVLAQQESTNSNEKRSALTETAVALDATGASVLEATLKTTTLNGSAETPVTNVRMLARNSSNISYAFVSGLVTFYDNTGVRCGEGLFKADVLAPDESFETDTPGIRIRCTPSTWRIVVTNLLPRIVPTTSPAPFLTRAIPNLLISIDGEKHPIQLDKPLTLNVGDRQRTVVVSAVP